MKGLKSLLFLCGVLMIIALPCEMAFAANPVFQTCGIPADSIIPSCGAVSYPGRFNFDRYLDLVVFERGDLGRVFILYGTGANTFAAPVQRMSSFCTVDKIPAVGDFNGDSLDDFAEFNRAYGDVRVALNDGGIAFKTPTLWHGSFCYGNEIPVVGNFNGDRVVVNGVISGVDDIATFTRGDSGDVFVALSDRTKFVGTSVKWHDNFCKTTEIPLAGDFNGDLKDDILTVRRDNGNVFFAASDGTKFNGTGVIWATAWLKGSYVPYVADYTGDGLADLVAFYYDDQKQGWWVRWGESNGSGFTNRNGSYDTISPVGKRSLPMVANFVNDSQRSDDILIFEFSPTENRALVTLPNDWFYGFHTEWYHN